MKKIKNYYYLDGKKDYFTTIINNYNWPIIILMVCIILTCGFIGD